jgi:AcrR family transcriptional regulator
MVGVHAGTVKYQLAGRDRMQSAVRVIPEREIPIGLPFVSRALRATISAMDVGTAANVEHRRRLLDGLAQVVALKGYVDTTIADIVREAGVSRRTFYEHFSSKSEALIALYEVASHNGLRVLEEHIDTRRDWNTQVEQALQAYLACLAQRPVLLRTLFIDILGLGRAGLMARRRVHESIASFVLEVVNARQAPPPLDRSTALAVVGGIHELVLHAIEQDPVADLQALAEPAARLVRAVARPRLGP